MGADLESDSIATSVARPERTATGPLRVLLPFCLEPNATLLLHTNHLSCRLPAGKATKVRVAVVALGNRLTKPQGRDMPAWMSPMERDSLFWRSRSEGVDVAWQVLTGCRDHSGKSKRGLCTWWCREHKRHQAGQKGPLRDNFCQLCPCGYEVGPNRLAIGRSGRTVPTKGLFKENAPFIS